MFWKWYVYIFSPFLNSLVPGVNISIALWIAVNISSYNGCLLLTVPSPYLNQCWPHINVDPIFVAFSWEQISKKCPMTYIRHYNCFQIYSLKITVQFPRGQWVRGLLKHIISKVKEFHALFPKHCYHCHIELFGGVYPYRTLLQRLCFYLISLCIYHVLWVSRAGKFSLLAPDHRHLLMTCKLVPHYRPFMMESTHGFSSQNWGQLSNADLWCFLPY